MLQIYVRPSRDLRNNYAEVSNLVKEHNQVIITNNGRGDSVLIGIDDYAQYEEYLHRRYVEEELAKSKAQADDSTITWKSHDEVWGRLKEKYDL